MFKANNKDTRTTSDFTHYSRVFIVNFEQVNATLVLLLLLILTRICSEGRGEV